MFIGLLIVLQISVKKLNLENILESSNVMIMENTYGLVLVGTAQKLMIMILMLWVLNIKSAHILMI